MLTLFALFLDLDGTLLNTEELKWRSHRKTVFDLRADWKLSDDEYLRLIGKSSQDAVAFICKKCGLDTTITYVGYRHRFDINYKDLLRKEARAHDGVLNFLCLARNQGIKTVVVSSSTTEEVILALQKTGLADEIDRMVSADDVRSPKPNPEPYFAALAHVPGATNRNSLALEDTEAGLSSAICAGLKVIGVLHPLNPHQDLRAAKRTIRKERFTDADGLLRLFNNILSS